LTEPNRPLPFAEASFDLIITVSVLTHVDEPTQDRLLEELRRVARPGGTVLITTHGARALQRAIDEERIFRMLDVPSAALRQAAASFESGRHSFICQQGH